MCSLLTFHPDANTSMCSLLTFQRDANTSMCSLLTFHRNDNTSMCSLITFHRDANTLIMCSLLTFHRDANTLIMCSLLTFHGEGRILSPPRGGFFLPADHMLIINQFNRKWYTISMGSAALTGVRPPIILFLSYYPLSLQNCPF